MNGLKTVGLLSLGLAMAACQQEEVNTAIPPIEGHSGNRLPDSQYLEILKDQGFDLRDVEIHEEGYTVEGDIYIPKVSLNAWRALPKQAQRQVNNMHDYNARSIRVQINPSISAWKAYVLEAINHWNSVQSNVYLTVVTIAPELYIAGDTDPILPSTHRNLASNLCGRAGFPISGNVYSFVSVNMDVPEIANDRKERVSLIAHEIGHALGLAHTNSGDGSLVSGTPGTDAGSIMNGSSCGDWADNLSDWDRKALLIKYPKDSPLFGMRMKEGDNREDLVVFRPANGNWYAKYSSTNFTTSQGYPWGERGDVAVPKMDIDGDGFADLVYWRPSTGKWHITTSSSNYSNPLIHQWGALGDIPLGGMDIDLDGKSDLVVRRWTDGNFYIKKSSTDYTTQVVYNLGLTGDIPVPDTDLDRDGKDDLIVWRPFDGIWGIRTSSSGFGSIIIRQWGAPGDIPVSGTDHDGDGKDEMIVYRSGDETMYMKLSGSNYTTESSIGAIGHEGDVPMSDIDINGDGAKDLSIWSRDGGFWRFRLGPDFPYPGTSFQWGA